MTIISLEGEDTAEIRWGNIEEYMDISERGTVITEEGTDKWVYIIGVNNR